MINKKIGAKIALALAAFALFFTACKSMPAAKGGMKMKKGMELAAWEGEWVSADSVKNDPSLEAAYRDTAAEMPNYTVDGFKAAISDMYRTPVIKAKFDGSNTVLFTVLDKEKKQVEIPCEYKYMGKVPIPGYKGSFWHTFEAVKDVRGLTGVKYFIAVAPGRHGEGLLHWHGRFGRYSIDWLVNGDTSWPTYFPVSTSNEEMAKNFGEGIKAMPQLLPKDPFESYAKFGKWISSSFIYDDMSKEVENVYAKLIKEFAGKNPKGGDFTKQEIIAEMKSNDMSAASVDDFSHLEFSIQDGKNELTVYKDGKEVFRSTYKRVAASSSKPYMTMQADRKDAGKFSLISFVVVHGAAPNQHFHLWYGASEKELGALKGTPTCYVDGRPAAVIAEQVEKSCRKKLQAITEKK